VWEETHQNFWLLLLVWNLKTGLYRKQVIDLHSITIIYIHYRERELASVKLLN